MDQHSGSITQLQRKLATMHQHVAALAVSEATAFLMNKTLQRSLERLSIAEEELRQQYEELRETRRTLEVGRLRYETLFALVLEGYLVTNTRGTIEEANPSAATLLGVSPEALVGKPLLIFIGQHDRQAFHTQLSHIMTQGRAQVWETYLQPRNGSPFPTDMTIAVSPERQEGGHHTLLWRFRDLTERKRFEKELWHAEHLTLLGTLAISVAHEIRNPLSAVLLRMDLLHDELQQCPAALNAPLLESLADIKTSLTHMHDVVEDYLSLARLGHLQRTPVDLGAFLTTFAEEIQPSCATCGITLSLEDIAALGEVLLYQSAFRRVLLNLVQNAIDAMPQGGTLTLRGHHAAAHLTLEVRDTGIGIPTEQLAQLFTLLRTTKAQGTGVGLYVAQEIIAAHGGTLAVQSETGRGTTFTITLPREPDIESPNVTDEECVK